jgi:hypothetical protein
VYVILVTSNPTNACVIPSEPVCTNRGFLFQDVQEEPKQAQIVVAKNGGIIHTKE